MSNGMLKDSLEMNAEDKASSAAARSGSSTSSWSRVPDCGDEDGLSQPGWMEQRGG